MSKTSLEKIIMVGAIGSLLLLQGCSEKIDARQTEEINGLLYKLYEKEPFTGTVTDYPISAFGLFVVGSCDLEVKKGIQEGTSICKNKNGDVIYKAELKNGKKNGIEETYDPETKNLKSKIEWSNGLKDGKEEQYDPKTNKLIHLVHWVTGQKDGKEQKWDVSGENLLIDLNWENGVQTGFVKDDHSEHHFKNGRYHGEQKIYQTKGENNQFYLSATEHYTEGKPDGVSHTFNKDGSIERETKYRNGVPLSILRQEWNKDKIISRVYLVNPSPEDNPEPLERDLVKDGKELKVNDENYYQMVGYRAGADSYVTKSEIEIEWSKGTALKGTYKAWHKQQLLDTLYGVPDADGALVKDGLEIERDANGNVLSEYKWQKGVLVSSRVNMYGMMTSTDEPDSNNLNRYFEGLEYKYN